MEDIELTLRSARVIRVFLEDPAKPRYGFELMRLVGISSGTLYPMLARLERAGWIAGSQEDPATSNPLVRGRPPRRIYTLTDESLPVAQAKLAALSQQFR